MRKLHDLEDEDHGLFKVSFWNSLEETEEKLQKSESAQPVTLSKFEHSTFRIQVYVIKATRI
jgi:hypothetical protein